MSIIENDLELAKELIDIFLRDSPKLLTELDAAIKMGDGHAIEKLAHRLKGNLKIVFSPHAVSLAEKIEQMGRTNQLEDCNLALTEFECTVKSLFEELGKFKSSINKSQ